MSPRGWSTLFRAAFRDSRNAMVLVGEDRRVVDVNGAFLQLLGHPRVDVVGRPIWEFVAGGALMKPREWAAALARRRFTGHAEMLRADGSTVHVEWGATTEVITGRSLVVVAALSVSARARGVRQAAQPAPGNAVLSYRQREIVRLVALGRTGPEIADELQITHNTVRTHLRNAMNRMGARSRAHLVAKALAEGHAVAQ
jgi:PAS domain S-box-containing protein